MTFTPTKIASAAPLLSAADRMRLLAMDIVAMSYAAAPRVDAVYCGVRHMGDGMLLASLVEQEAWLADPALDEHLDNLNPWRDRIALAEPEVR